jgi:NAD(P)-dependent dehydrogenase (short-subunit alcohol dehydrogenase family)
MRELAGKVAVITGGGDGIGKAMALAFAAEGMCVVLADIDVAAMQAVAVRIAERGGQALCVRTDVVDPASVAALADTVQAQLGGVHVLCNNAGIVGSLSTPIRDLDLGAWNWTLDVNLRGVIHVIHAFLGRMLAAGQEAHIVNTASMAGLVGTAGGGAYCASKHAVVSISRTLRLEAAAAGIGVSVLCPGYVDTGLVRNTVQAAAARAGLPADARAAGIDPGVMASLGKALDAGMDPARVAAMVVDSVRANRFYILTHPGSLERIEELVVAPLRADYADLHARFR